MRGLAVLISILVGSSGLAQTRVSCELAPAWGRGQSTLGQIDQATQLAAGCSYAFSLSPHLSLGPRLLFSDQEWTIDRTPGEAAELLSLQARSWQLGILATQSWSRWTGLYGWSIGQGQGQLERTLSTPNSRQSATYSGLDYRSQQHEIGFRYQAKNRWSYGLSFLRSQGRQSWSQEDGRFVGESVDQDTRLTLTSGSLNLAAPQTTQLEFVSSEIRFGVQLLFH
jgi:hypothetical protein